MAHYAVYSKYNTLHNVMNIGLAFRTKEERDTWVKEDTSPLKDQRFKATASNRSIKELQAEGKRKFDLNIFQITDFRVWKG
jgi:hypothetical protein